jgi:RHS repeat-associated protein
MREAVLTDAAGAIVRDMVTTPFGELAGQAGAAAYTADAGFPGQRTLMEIGGNVSYNWHRHYDASLGRYLQPDPLGLIDGPNRFAYVGSNPVMWSDPRGETGIKFLGPGGGGRVCGIICGPYGFRMDYDPNPSPSKLHFHCGRLDSGGSWGGHRPWFAPWRVY